MYTYIYIYMYMYMYIYISIYIYLYIYLYIDLNCFHYWKQRFKTLDWGSTCSNPCESELTCFRPESNRGPYRLLNFLSAALFTTELW